MGYPPCRLGHAVRKPSRRLGRAKPPRHGSWNWVINASTIQQNEIDFIFLCVSCGAVLKTSMGSRHMLDAVGHHSIEWGCEDECQVILCFCTRFHRDLSWLCLPKGIRRCQIPRHAVGAGVDGFSVLWVNGEAYYMLLKLYSIIMYNYIIIYIYILYRWFIE